MNAKKKLIIKKASALKLFEFQEQFIIDTFDKN